MLSKFIKLLSGKKEDKTVEVGLIELFNGKNPTKKADIIFVHGLGGDLRETWRGGKSEEFWPDWLGEDLSKAELLCGVWLFGYDSKKFFIEPGQTAPRYDRARSLLAYLQTKNLGNKPIFFITHSLGGLVVKEMLRVADTNNSPVLQQTQGVVFIAKPHIGSDLATLVGIIGKITSNLLKESVNTEELKAHNAGLRDLDEWYRQKIPNFGIKTLPFYEIYNTWGFRVVDEDSGNPKISNQNYFTPVEANHISIAKCRTPEALVYLTVKKFIQEILEDIEKKTINSERDITLENMAWNKLEYLHFESFDADNIEYNIWSFSDDKIWTYKISNGVYQLRNEGNSKSAKYIHINLTSLPNNVDIDISEAPVSVEVKLLAVDYSGFSGGGLMYRFDDNSRKYYAFILFSDGRFGFYRKDKEAYLVLYSARLSTIQFNQFHKLGIAAKGNVFYLYIDDCFVKTVRDSELVKGNVGIIAWGIGEYLFDNFIVFDANI